MLGKVQSMPLVLNISGFWIAQNSEYVSGSECARVLDTPGFSICLWFWICQSFGYTRLLNMSLILNIPEFWICQGYTGFRICLNNPWICLNMLECLNMAECLLFYISTFPPLFYNFFSTLTRGYLFERLQETRAHSLKEHEAVFLFKFYVTFQGWDGEGGGWWPWILK